MGKEGEQRPEMRYYEGNTRPFSGAKGVDGVKKEFALTGGQPG